MLHKLNPNSQNQQRELSVNTQRTSENMETLGRKSHNWKAFFFLFPITICTTTTNSSNVLVSNSDCFQGNIEWMYSLHTVLERSRSTRKYEFKLLSEFQH